MACFGIFSIFLQTAKILTKKWQKIWPQELDKQFNTFGTTDSVKINTWKLKIRKLYYSKYKVRKTSISRERLVHLFRVTAINPWPSTNLALHSKPQCVKGTPLKLEKSLSFFE